MNQDKFERNASAVVEAIIKFFQWTPNWLLWFVGFISLASTMYVMFLGKTDGLTIMQYLVYGLCASIVTLACGSALFIKSHNT